MIGRPRWPFPSASMRSLSGTLQRTRCTGKRRVSFSSMLLLLIIQSVVALLLISLFGSTSIPAGSIHFAGTCVVTGV